MAERYYDPERCHEAVQNGGCLEPCDKPVVGLAVGEFELYPACAEHAWLEVVGTLVATPRGDEDLVYRLRKRGANDGQ